jgi:hypothetical protein
MEMEIPSETILDIVIFIIWTPIGGHNNEIANNNNCKMKRSSFHIASSALCCFWVTNMISGNFRKPVNENWDF